MPPHRSRASLRKSFVKAKQINECKLSPLIAEPGPGGRMSRVRHTGPRPADSRPGSRRGADRTPGGVADQHALRSFRGNVRGQRCGRHRGRRSGGSGPGFGPVFLRFAGKKGAYLCTRGVPSTIMHSRHNQWPGGGGNLPGPGPQKGHHCGHRQDSAGPCAHHPPKITPACWRPSKPPCACWTGSTPTPRRGSPSAAKRRSAVSFGGRFGWPPDGLRAAGLLGVRPGPRAPVRTPDGAPHLGALWRDE